MSFDWKAHEKYHSKLKRFTKLYARMQMNGRFDYRLLCNVYGDPKENKPEVKVKRMLRSQTVQKMVESEILSLYEGAGITAESVVSDEDAILSLAFNTNDLSNAVKIVHKWGARIGMDPKEIRQSISITGKTSDYKALLEGEGVKQLGQSSKDKPAEDSNE